MAELNQTEQLEVHPLFPTIVDYYTDLEIFTIVTIAIGGLLFLINKVIFLQSLCQIFKTVRPTYRWHTLALCGIYPIVALMALLTLLIPPAGLIFQSIMHVSFTICAYQLYLLFFKYVGGEQQYIKEADSDVFNIRTPPCCCCCVWFKPMSATLNRISAVRYMILQFPFIQTAIVIVVNLIYFLQFDIFEMVNFYFTPFMVVSILIGLWGLNILVRLIQPHAQNHYIMLKYLCIQLVLVFCKLQPAILEGVFSFINFPAEYPLTEAIYKQGIIQLAILTEMVFLSILAQKAYQKPQSV